MKLRTASPADLDEIVELMRCSLGEGTVPRTKDFFQWKHFDNPFGRSPILLAEDGGRLVGLRAFLRWELRAPGRTYRAVRAVDTATHPDFRGRGIFKRLTLELVRRMCDERVDFVFNTPNEKSGPGYRKMGWVEVGSIPVWVRPGLGFAHRFFDEAKGQLDDRECSALRRAAASDVPSEWARKDFEDRAHTPRDARYLRWRYVDVPGIDYGAAYDPARYLIVFRRRVRRGLRETTVCELLVAPSRRARAAAFGALLRLATRAEVVTCAASASLAMNRALRLSSLRLAGPMLMSRELASSPVEGFARWGWSLGDLELF